METKFNFNSQICTTLLQSERLLALGLKKETADMGIIEGTEIDVIEVDWEEHSRHNSTPNFVSLPAWSLHRLIEMIQDAIVNKDGTDDNLMLDISGIGLYDGTIDAIAELIKEGYFNKEYLEE